MRLLAVKFDSGALFPEGLTLKLNTCDGVRHGLDSTDDDQPAFKIAGGFYSQVLIALTGLNATGKTSALELLSLVLYILLEDRNLKDPLVKRILQKNLPQDAGSMRHEVVFLKDQRIFRLESVIRNRDDSFVYEDESLQYLPLSRLKNKKDLFDNVYDPLKNRADEDNPYLKGEISIVASINGECTEAVFSNGSMVNDNRPRWSGHTSEDLLACFDPGIKTLEITVDDERHQKARIEFLRDGRSITADPASLEDLLSSGTIKGLTLMPQIIGVLRRGGYLILDELEDHFNRRIIEFILSLFTDRRTNPHGACLVFSTHYPELLDLIPRKDNIFITRRGEDNALQMVRLSECPAASRNDLQKSRMIIFNLVKGTAPKAMILKSAREYLQRAVNS